MPKLPPLLWLVALILLTAGCNTTNSITKRIHENPSLYTKLEPDQKAYIQDGIVFPGDNADMAYMALGHPDSVETKTKDDITVTMWTYNKYYPQGELADFLTDYSLSRNPSLLRGLNIESGSGTISDNAPNVDSDPIRDSDAHGAGTNTFNGVGPGISLPDIPVYKLYVLYYRAKITDVQIESLDGTIFTWREDAIAMEEARKG